MAVSSSGPASRRAPGSFWMAGSSVSSVGLSSSANSRALTRLERTVPSVPGRRSSVPRRLTSSLGDGRQRGVGRRHDVGDLGVLGGRRLGEDREVADQALELGAALGQRRGDLADLLHRRAERAEELVEVAAAAFEALGGAVDQQVEVGAGVGVERVGQLVGVDRHARRLDRDDAAVVERLAGRAARAELDHEVLERRVRDELGDRVVVDVRELVGVDLHRDPSAAVDDLRSRDLPDPHAGDVDRLAEAGGEAAGRGDVGVDRVAIHGRQRQTLVDEDVGARGERQQREERDREHEAPVGLERALHRVASCSTWSSSQSVWAFSFSSAVAERTAAVCEGALPSVRCVRSTSAWSMQFASGRLGGSTPGPR